MRNIKIFFWVLFGLVVLFWAVIFASSNSLNSDEGMALNAAWQMWQGKLMFVDFYEFVSPGAEYFTLFSWKIFGVSYLSTKLLAVLFLFFSLLGVFYTSWVITKKYSLSLIAVMFWFLASCFHPLINHNAFSSFVAVWVLLLLFLVVERKSKYLYFLLGAVLAVCFWFLQTKGLSLLFSVSIIILIFGPRKIISRVEALVLLLAGFVVLFKILFLPWSINVLYHSLIILPLSNNYLSTTPICPLYIVVVIFIILLMFSVSFYQRKINMWVLSIMQLGLFMSSWQLMDLAHLLINIFPFLIFVALLIDILIPKMILSIKYSLMALLFLVLLFVGLFSLSNSILLGRSIKNIIPIEISEAEYIYAGPFLPGIYFELGKPNPFYLTHNMALCPEECFNKTTQIFTTVNPEFAILNYDMVHKYSYNKDNILDNYIKNNYHNCGKLLNSSVIIFARDNCPVIMDDK